MCRTKEKSEMKMMENWQSLKLRELETRNSVMTRSQSEHATLTFNDKLELNEKGFF